MVLGLFPHSPARDCSDARAWNGDPLVPLVRFTPASSIAFVFAKAAWPLAWVSRTGLFGDALLSASCRGNGSVRSFTSNRRQRVDS